MIKLAYYHSMFFVEVKPLDDQPNYKMLWARSNYCFSISYIKGSSRESQRSRISYCDGNGVVWSSWSVDCQGEWNRVRTKNRRCSIS